ncbi:unnamed protein product [Durusdinium trenchii]|uniref:Uncharacterized protein n=1 Tax=Durusdinium trenchii TaxID=1381693 RepID=A0ABP0SAR1_9DINO
MEVAKSVAIAVLLCCVKAVARHSGEDGGDDGGEEDGGSDSFSFHFRGGVGHQPIGCIGFIIACAFLICFGVKKLRRYWRKYRRHHAGVYDLRSEELIIPGPGGHVVLKRGASVALLWEGHYRRGSFQGTTRHRCFYHRAVFRFDESRLPQDRPMALGEMSAGNLCHIAPVDWVGCMPASPEDLRNARHVPWVPARETAPLPAHTLTEPPQLPATSPAAAGVQLSPAENV